MQSKYLVIGGVLLLVLIGLLFTCSKPTPDAKSLGINMETSPGSGADPDAKPFDTKVDFQIYWEKHLKAAVTDNGRIQATLKAHREWVKDILPESFSDGKSNLNSRRWNIIFPFLTAGEIDSTDLLVAYGAVERAPKDITILVKNGADINAQGLLHNLTTTEMLEYFLKLGTDPNKVDKYGDTPYDTFVRLNFKDKALTIQKYGGHGK